MHRARTRIAAGLCLRLLACTSGPEATPSTPVDPPDLDSLLAAALTAAGGPAEMPPAIEEEWRVTLHFPGGARVPARLHRWEQAPDAEREELVWAGGSLLTVCRGGEGARHENGVLVSRSVPADSERRRLQRSILQVLIREGSGHLLGTKQLEGRTVWIVERTVGTDTFRVGIDAADHRVLVVGCDVRGAKGTVVWEDRYEDFQTSSVGTVPHRIRSFRDGTLVLEKSLVSRRVPAVLDPRFFDPTTGFQLHSR